MLKTSACALLLVLPIKAAGAQSGPKSVLLLASPGGRPELATALRIHLTGLATVREVEQPHGAETSLSERIAFATELRTRERALAVLWTEGPSEQASGSHESILYVAGQRAGRALVQAVSAPFGTQSDVDRTLALKVRELLQDLLAAGEAEPPAPLGEPSAQNSDSGPRQPPPEPWRLGARLEAAALAGTQAGSSLGQWGMAAAAGPVLLAEKLRASALLELAFFPRLGLERAGSLVRVQSLAPGLALRGDARLGPLWVGPRLGVALSFLSVQGRDADAVRGSERDLRVLVLFAGVAAELPLPPYFALYVACDAELRPSRQLFTVRGQEIADLGRLRPLARVGAAFTLP